MNKLALRADARRDPPRAQYGGEASARAADGLRSQSKIAAQESPQAWGAYCVRPPDEHAIWQSEMSLKRGRWGHGEAHGTRHVYCGHIPELTEKSRFLPILLMKKARSKERAFLLHES